MTLDYQTTKILVRGYEAVFRRPLAERIAELQREYPATNALCSELGILAETVVARAELARAVGEFLRER